MAEFQSSDLYGCSCGQSFRFKKEFNSHQMGAGKLEKGAHKSIGRLSPETLEVTMPPYLQRTKEQKAASVYAAKQEKAGQANPPEETPLTPPESEAPTPPETVSEAKTAKKKKTKTTATGPVATSIMGSASSLNLITRSYTIDFPPILRLAMEASKRFWAWPDLPLGDFIVTIVYRYFKGCGITLGGIEIDETEPERAEREAMVAASMQERENGGNEGEGGPDGNTA